MEYVEGKVLVKIKPGVSMNSIQKVIPSAILEMEVGGHHLIAFKDITVQKAIELLTTAGIVEYAQPDHVYKAFEITPYHPNDPYYADGNQWALWNTGQNGGVAGADIRAPLAWRLLYEDGKTIGSSAVKVGVIDTGVNYNHPDLSENCKKSDGADFYNTDADAMDDGDHGTHVAGIIGAKGNNGSGVSGVAWNCRIIPIKSLGPNMEATDSTILYGLDHADFMGCPIVNMSFGSYSYSSALYNKMAGMTTTLFVCAAGNDAKNNDSEPVYPASFGLSNIISVANTNNKDELNTHSNYGNSTVHLAAPGSNICSTLGSDAYVWLSGTSMAAPMVTGVAVLLKGAFPALTVAQIRAAILNNVDVIPALSGKCITGGRLNAYKAFNGLISDPSAVTGIRRQSSIGEVPNDDKMYDRRNGRWVEDTDAAGDYIAGDGITISNGEISVSFLDENGKIDDAMLPASLVGSLVFKGTFNPALGAPQPAAQGYYYIASAEGTVATIDFLVGDWLVYRNDTSFDKIDNQSLSVAWANVTNKPETFAAILGETSDTAYRGDRGKIAYDHAISDHAASDAEKNVQPDWNQTDNTQDDFIKNKPTISGDYELPVASDTVLGGVKIGDRISIVDGVISADLQEGDVTGPETSIEGRVPTWDAENKKLTSGIPIGTAAGNLVQLTEEGRLPAIDGSLLTNVVANQGSYVSITENYTLPVSPSQGDIVEVIGTGVNWTLTANSGQYIRLHISESASGGTIASTSGYDSVTLMYVGALGGHNTWLAKYAMGVLDVV